MNICVHTSLRLCILRSYVCVFVCNVTTRVENRENHNPITVIHLILLLYLSIYSFLVSVCV